MKQERLEFLNTYSNFLKQVLPIGQQMPVAAPMIIELMKYGVQAFKQARTIEGVLDQALMQIQQMAAQPQPPNPEMQKMQAQTQVEQAKLQAEQQNHAARLQNEAQIEQLKLQHDAQVEQMKAQFEAQKLAQEHQFERWKAELESATRIMAARIAANPGLDVAGIQAQQAVSHTIAQDLGASINPLMPNIAPTQQ